MPSTASSSPSKSPAKIPSSSVVTTNTSVQHPPTQHVPATSRPTTQSKTANPQHQPQTPATPCDRWETLYVYAFLIKFLPPAVDDLYDPMGFEEALTSTGFNQILYDILNKFLGELRLSNEGPVSPETVNAALRSVVVQLCAKNPHERTVWWIDSSGTNAHPFVTEDVDFFAMSWMDKLVVLRQLVDWQLAYSNAKEVIDIAWEVKYQRKKKKTNKTLAAEFAPPDEDDPMSINNLRMVALGQDSSRMRYWVIDDSPRVWASPNPWRMNCPMKVVATTRDEYAAFVEKIRDDAPVVEGAKTKMTKPQQAHVELLPALEARLDAIDAYEERVEAMKLQRKAEIEENGRSSVKTKSAAPRTRGRASTRKSEDVDEMDVEEADDEPGPSTSKGKAKGRSSVSKKKSASKKRKRESSPEASDVEKAEETPQEVEAPAPEDAQVRTAGKGKAATVTGRRKSARGTKVKPIEENEDDEDVTPQEQEEQEEPAATPKAKFTRSKTKNASKAVEDPSITEDAVVPEEDVRMAEESTRPALGPRRSTRTSTVRVAATPSVKDEEEEGAAATSSVSAQAKKPVATHAVGSRRSGRLSKVESDHDVKPELDIVKAEHVSEAIKDASTLEVKEEEEVIKAPPRKKTRTTRRSRAQDEDKMESASTSTVADEDAGDKIDIDVASTDATASPNDPGARKKLPPSESRETTPVNPSRALSALGPQSPVIKSDWAADPQMTNVTSAVTTA
ncbi:hypothetical protein FRB90_011853 [Tulasnella sp. 427]|nr:hypothetical protein FRB90_011853 [Tulasnella sp. 427]